jgi:hypothetical protein
MMPDWMQVSSQLQALAALFLKKSLTLLTLYDATGQ